MVKKTTTKKKLPIKRSGDVGYNDTDLKAAFMLGAKLVEKKHNLQLTKKEKDAGFQKVKKWLKDNTPFNYKKIKPKK